MVAYGEENEGVIFSDLIQDTGDKLEVYRYPEFDETRLAIDMRYAGSSVLVPRHAAEKVLALQGGWDVDIPGMEDGITRSLYMMLVFVPIILMRLYLFTAYIPARKEKKIMLELER